MLEPQVYPEIKISKPILRQSDITCTTGKITTFTM